MRCCGQSQAIYAETSPSSRSLGPRTATRRHAVLAGRYEYTGPTRLTVRAPLSGRTYVFDGPGAVLDVDPVDASSLATVPGLKAVSGRPSPVSAG